MLDYGCFMEFNDTKTKILRAKLNNYISAPKGKQNDRKIFEIAKYLYIIGESNESEKYILAKCYLYGIGTSVNESIALDLFIQISDSSYVDDLDFQKQFAYLLERNHNSTCLFFYYKAACQGDRYSNFKIAEIVRKGTLLPDVDFFTRYICAKKYYNKLIEPNLNDPLSKLSMKKLTLLERTANENKLLIRKQNAIMETLL